jgi:hypothetical protein
MDPLSIRIALGAAASVAADPVTAAEVFSPNVYTGNGSTQSIDNGLNLSGEGGLTWIKCRSSTFGNGSYLYDTERGSASLQTNTTAAQASPDTRLNFDSSGFNVTTSGGSATNASGFTFVGWSFRKAPGFFDVVTWTGNGAASRSISHSLDSVPGMVIIKSTSSASYNWVVYHRSTGSTQKLRLNLTDAAVAENGNLGGLSPTSTAFGVGYGATNANGENYVAYVFAHNDARFGANRDKSIVNCGTYTGSTGNVNVDCGFTTGARFVIIKRTDSSGDWFVFDTARGIVSGNDPYLLANSSAAEVTNTDYIDPLNSGFTVTSSAPAALNNNGGNYIFMAIA